MKKILIGMIVLALAVSASAAGKKKSKKAKPAPESGFETALNVGLSLTDGNSETLTANGSLVTEGEKDGLGSVLAGVEANYGENTVVSETTDEATGETMRVEEDDTTVNNAKAYVNVKKTLSDMTFAYLDGSVLTDDIALIDYRAMTGPGLGAYLIKNDQRTLSLEAGPSYLWEKVSDVSDDYLVLRFAERYVCQATETAKLIQSLEYIPEASDFDSYLLNAEIGLEAAMNDHLSLRVVLQDTYDSTPAAEAERNDLSLIAGIGLTL